MSAARETRGRLRTRSGQCAHGRSYRASLICCRVDDGVRGVRRRLEQADAALVSSECLDAACAPKNETGPLGAVEKSEHGGGGGLHHIPPRSKPQDASTSSARSSPSALAP